MSKLTTQARAKSAPMKVPAKAPTAKRDKPVSGVERKRIIEEVAALAPKAYSTPNIHISFDSLNTLQRKEIRVIRTKTLRLEPAFEAGLVILKGIIRKPINKMVNEAVGEYITRRAAQVESQLTTTLEELKAYRRADPNFTVARKAFIEAEARYGKQDPMEGRVVKVTPPLGAYANRHASDSSMAPAKEGPALSMVRELLRS